MSADAGPRYPYVAIDVAEEDAEEASAELFERGASGVEWRDATTLTRGVAGRVTDGQLSDGPISGGTIADGQVTLIASFEREDDARAAAAELSSAWSPRVEHVVGDGWRDEWKKHFEPFRIAGGIVVCPPWARYEPGASETVIVLEPGRAFGTGLHETTSLVAQVLVDQVERFRGSPVLDVGCGSGILSLVGLVLGATRARAIDVDPDAIAVTRENAERNGLGARLVADGAPVHALADRYATVVANIESQALVELAPALVASVAAGGLLILSGILAPDVAPGQLADIRRAFCSLKEEGVHRKGEWVAVAWSA